MSDIDPSGAATTAAETASAPSTPPPPAIVPGTFSNNRGSGLARGKRPTSPSTQAPSTAPAADYKPTAVTILTAPTEYKNPFAPPAPPPQAAAPEAAAPAPAVVAPMPTAPAAEVPTTQDQAPAALPTEAPAPAPVSEAPAAPVQEPAPAAQQPADITADSPKPELKILPPEAPRRVEQSWESKSFGNVAGQPAPEARQPDAEARQPDDRRPGGQRPYREDRRGDRPYYRPERERRDDRPVESREPRPDSEPQGQAHGGDRGQDGPAPAPVPDAPKKSGGMFGWVKKLFGIAPAETPKAETRPETPGNRESNQDGPYRRRRHRGGRGRNNFQGDQRGPRDGQSGGQQSGDPRGYRGDQRGYGGDQRQQGHRRHDRPGGGGFRGNGRPDGGPPPSGS